MITWRETFEGGVRRIQLRADVTKRLVATLMLVCTVAFAAFGIYSFSTDGSDARGDRATGAHSASSSEADGKWAFIENTFALPDEFDLVFYLSLVVGALVILSIPLAILLVVLRVWLGTDRIDLHPDHFRVRRAIGPFGFERHFHPAEIEAITTRGYEVDLFVMTSDSCFTVCSCGTEAERRRLGTLLRDQYRLLTPVERLDGAAPPGWLEEREQDGSLRLEDTFTRYRVRQGSVAVQNKLFGKTRDDETITDGAVMVRAQRRNHRYYYHLFLNQTTAPRVSVANSPTEILALAKIFARETGWPLDVPLEARELE